MTARRHTGSGVITKLSVIVPVFNEVQTVATEGKKIKWHHTGGVVWNLIKYRFVG